MNAKVPRRDTCMKDTFMTNQTINITPQQLDDITDLVERMISQANITWAREKDKKQQSIRVYEGIRDWCEQAQMLTEKQVKTLVIGARMLKQTVPLWLDVAMNWQQKQAQKHIDLDRIGLEIPQEPEDLTQDLKPCTTPKAHIEAIAKHALSLIDYVEALETRLRELEQESQRNILRNHPNRMYK
jgi:hypothetical protein